MDRLARHREETYMTGAKILETVDEYMLYCFYLGFEPELRTRYHSPLRDKDDRASFSLYEASEELHNGAEFLWKDSGWGLAGDIFKFVQLLYGLPKRHDAEQLVARQIKLGFYEDQRIEGGKLKYQARPSSKPPVNIRILSREWNDDDLQYWMKYNISREILELYEVRPVKYFWLYDDQDVPFTAHKYAYAYGILDRFKLYSPFNKENKFINNYAAEFVEGFLQLTYETDTLIITKSTKDVMALRSLGYDAVSPKSENTVIPEAYFDYFRSKYTNIVVLFDNDMKHKGDDYPFPKVYVPVESGTKDFTDFIEAHGVDKAKKLIELLTK